MAFLVLEVRGIKSAIRTLGILGRKFDDLREPFDEIAEDVGKTGARAFEVQGPGWAPLSPAYVQRKTMGDRILVRSGRLRDLMSSPRGYDVTRDKRNLKIRLTDPIAIIHQTGLGVPVRPIIRATKRDRTRWTGIVRRWMVAEAREVGVRIGFRSL